MDEVVCDLQSYTILAWILQQTLIQETKFYNIVLIEIIPYCIIYMGHSE